jgi:hypothetical protein
MQIYKLSTEPHLCIRVIRVIRGWFPVFVPDR